MMTSFAPEENELLNQGHSSQHCDRRRTGDEDQEIDEADGETDHSDSNVLFSKVWRSLYISMTVCGLVWKTFNLGVLSTRWHSQISTIHCSIVLILVWFNALKYFLHTITLKATDQSSSRKYPLTSMLCRWPVESHQAYTSDITHANVLQDVAHLQT